MMQAVILAAGKSTRCYPLTVERPKPNLMILDKTILQHNLDQLIETGKVDEVIIVVGFQKGQIIQKLGTSYGKLKITYIEQEELNGTGGAILACKEMLKGRFLVLNGDDLYSSKDLSRLMEKKMAVLGTKVKDPTIWGMITVKEGKVVRFEEKPDKTETDIGNVGAYVFDTSIFQYEIKKTKRGELEIIDFIKHIIKEKKDFSCVIIEDYWLPVGYPWHYLEANVFFARRIKGQTIKGKVEEGVSITGDVYIGEGSVIKLGTVIEGPAYIGKDCVIGPCAYIRKETIIMDKVRTRSEIIDSVLMEGVTAKHTSYIGHSVIGKGCNIAAGTITADYRHDGGDHTTPIQGKKVKTMRRKLGAFIGDRVTTGIGTLIYPGRKIWPACYTLPGEIVKKDKTGDD